MPYAHYSQIEYKKLLDDWFTRVENEKDRPNERQRQILHKMRERILCEFELFTEGPDLQRKLLKKTSEDEREEPLRGLIHGLPGTGKSRVIKWLCRMFGEALKWEHGNEFVCVAFQNRVAHAIRVTHCIPQQICPSEGKTTRGR